MVAESGLQAVYSNLSQSRLESAGILLQLNPNCPSDDGMEGLITRCNIAMLVWSAAVDIGSSLLIQEDHRVPTGNSSEITSYITRTIARQFPSLELPTMWRRLVRLHNVQHRADHPVSRFTDSCRSSHDAFASINQLLDPESKLDPASFNWLSSIRNV